MDKELAFIGAQKGTRSYHDRGCFYKTIMSETNVDISRYPIRLGQFLKLAEIAQDGLEAKALILKGEVEVNGEVELRRGKQLQKGDIITFEKRRYFCK